MNPINLQNKRILVTGASSGIGRACAICASRMGARIILTGRRRDALKETLAMCEGEDHLAVEGDITSLGFIGELAKRSGRINGLVHAAGVMDVIPLKGLETPALERIMSVNFTSFLNLAKVFTKRIYSEDGCAFVAISSTAGTAAWQGGIPYCSSKSALESATRVLALEYARPRLLRFNTVSPSYIRTAILDSAVGIGVDAKSLIDSKQPLGLGEPEQVAWPVCFLLSDAANFITGVNLPVDGVYLSQ